MKTTNSHEFEYATFKSAKRALRYDGTEPFEQWQKKAKAKLEELLGLPFEKCDAEFTVEYTKELESCTEYRFTVQTEVGYYVPCHLLIPKNVPQPVPLTLCMSGHGGGMHVALGRAKNEKDEKALAEWPHRNMSGRAVREGRCALVIEPRNFGESSLTGYGTSCEEAAKIAILNGRTVIGERVWDAMRIMDAVAANFPQVDMNNIVCTGNSGGGTVTYYLGCLDERIGVCAPSCSVCTFEESIAAMRHCMCNHIPSIRKYFEMGDFGGIIAPRKLVIAAGETDNDFLIKGVRDAYAEIERLYEAAGVKENCALVINPSGHFNYADEIWQQIHKWGI